MIVQAFVAVTGVWLTMKIIARVVEYSGGGYLKTFFAQTLIVGSGAGLLYTQGIVSGLFAIGMALLPVVLHVVTILWFVFVGYRVLSGKHGEQAMWAAEIVRDGDEDFEEASDGLTQRELREVGIIADSKEELREKTIQRFEEKQKS
jgi:hypothetical protein